MAGRLFAGFYLIRRLVTDFTRRSRDRLKLLFVITVLNQSITLLLHALARTCTCIINSGEKYTHTCIIKPVSYLTKILCDILDNYFSILYERKFFNKDWMCQLQMT